MNLINRTVLSLAAAAGLAVSAAAQEQTRSSIVSVAPKTTSSVVAMINGVEHRVAIENGEVTEATIDGLEVDHRLEDDVIILLDGDGREVEIPRPMVTEDGPGIGMGGAIDLGIGEGLAELRLPEGMIGRGFDGNARGGLAGAEQPTTMVGLTQAPVDDQLRAHLGLDEDEGMLVIGLVGGLPAESAGMKAADVLIEIDGQPVTGSRTLTEALREREPGDVLGVVVLRKGSPVSLEIELAAYDPAKLNVFRFPGHGFGGNNEPFRLGIDLDELARLPGVNNDEIFEQLQMAREQARAAREQNQRARREIELLVRPGGGGGQAIVIEGERATIEQAERARRERDRLRDEAADIIAELAELDEQIARGDLEGLAELAGRLESVTDRAADAHHDYEPLRRRTQRDWHPEFAAADELRRLRDELHSEIRTLARELDGAVPDRDRIDEDSDEAEELLDLVEGLGGLSEDAAAVHAEFEPLRRLTQRDPGEAEREARGTLRSVNDRMDELESKLDRLIDAIEDRDE
ncbi:MAG: PDZ domain-containing protein [Planctomycetota bacterium]